MKKLLAILIFASCVSASAQTTTTCGETSQKATDTGNAFWQLGTPCATGTNSGGYTVSSISYWVGTPTSTSFDLGVYSNSSGSPSSLLCSVSTGTITPSSGWNSVNISSCPTLSASTTYWVGYITGSDAIQQGTVSGACPGTSYHSTWANAMLSGVSLANPFPANTQGKTCYSLYMTLTNASVSTGSLAVTTTSLPNGQVGTAYSATLGATGGTSPYTWSLTSGTLPAGLNLSASGVISGTPTASVNATALTFKVTDSSSPVQTQSATISITVNSSQTATTCGETSQTGTDTGDALWQLGTPCATGTNSGGYTVSSISYWVGTPTSTSFDLGVYSNSSGSPSSLLCSVSTGTITPSSGWNSVNISSCPTLSASTTYWVGYITGSDAIQQGTVSGACPGTSYHSTWANAMLSGVSLANPFPANTQGKTCYSLYMTLTNASVSTGSLAVTTTSLPNGQVGTAYSATLGATGGTTPYTWSLTSGTLSAGLSLSASGVISGTPTASVNATALTFKVTDSGQPAQNQSATLSLTIAPAALVITTGSLPNGQVGTAYSATLAATGGTSPYTWSLTSGTLPSGLSLNAATGAIGGTPTASVNATALTFKVTDSSNPVQTQSASLTLTIAATLAITTTSLPNGQVGTAYSATLGATGGTTPYTWSLTSGTLPAGLSLSASGVISGTPTASVNATALTFKVTDSSNPVQTQSASLTLTIAATLAVTTTSLPNGQVGTAYSATLAATGGTSPYTWSLTSGTLPAGLSLSASGVISGTPTASVNATALTFKVTDSSSPVQTQSATISITVNSSQTATTCGETSQTGTDTGDAFWQLGTPCATGTNSGGYTVSSISYWVGTPTSTSFDLGVYSNSSGSPSSLLCSVSTGTITPSSGWNSVNISSCPTLSASTTYWVGYITGSDAIQQGTVSGACPGTSYHSTWANAMLSGVSLANPFPANTQVKLATPCI